MRMRFTVRAWILVLLGIVLNAIAVVMSSVVLDRSSAQLQMWSEQKQQNLYSIQLAWNKLDILERKEEMLMLYLSKPDRSEALDKALSLRISYWLQRTMPEIDISHVDVLVGALEEVREVQRDQIDGLYIENLSLQEKMRHYSERYQLFRNIALMLQILGLTLILARDLGRR